MLQDCVAKQFIAMSRLLHNRVNVIYRVNEGDKTKISRIDFIGNNTFSGRRLADVISTKETGLFGFLQTSDIYDEGRLNSDEELLRRPRGNRNFETNTIDVTYLVDEGARVFIEDIRIVGNDRTRDYVIRREFEISEGDAYNRVLVQKTRRRIQSLGFFENVSVSTRPGSEPDRW